MPYQEYPWRVRQLVRKSWETALPGPTATRLRADECWLTSSGPISPSDQKGDYPRRPSLTELAGWPQMWRANCLAEAEKILSGNITIFGTELSYVSPPVDWQLDPISRIRVPLISSAKINYRDPSQVGDIKYVWELGRMQHLVRLGQAWRLTNSPRFADAVVNQITDWILANPWRRGAHWASPMECALRLISWTWAFDYIRDSKAVTSNFVELIGKSVFQHLEVIDQNYSKYSSANNHLIAEAAGAYIAATYWSGLTRSRLWRQNAYRHLNAECLKQNTSDGVNIEHSFSYQIFVWELLLHGALAGRSAGQEFSPAYWKRLESMSEFIGSVTDIGLNMPNTGDQDDGVAIRLGDSDESLPSRMLVTAGLLFGRTDLQCWGGGNCESAAWLLGDAGKDLSAPLAARKSRSFAIGGYHIFRGGEQSGDVLLLFDTAPNGDRGTAAHGHADALSVTLSVGGEVFLADPGTYSYQDGPLRHFFRSTSQHSTLAFGDGDQSEYLNRFLWGRRESIGDVQFTHTESGSEASAHVEWWTKERHERRIRSDWQARSIEVEDHYHGSRTASLNFIVAPGIAVTKSGERTVTLSGRAANVRLEFDHGDVGIVGTEFSPRCYQKVQSQKVVVGLNEMSGSIVTKITWRGGHQ